ncbi:MAG TPA: hypothetical protein VNV86_00865 [Candidatus Acidoferrum sp.]|jgi:hypothetical protein|nr:hypothetical protein [Candidatus Acidoferrum sp.]
MTPIPLHLPLRPSEAAEIAALIFEHAERKPLTDELRNRLAARAVALRLEGIVPYFGSLARDPVHPSSYYLAVDGIETPHLLHLAFASAPTSSIFHKALLIGRTCRLNGPEFVINAIPFGPTDRESIDRFVALVDTAFLPRPQGSRASLTIRSDYQRAFEFFGALHKRRGRNLAAVAGDYHACVWAAIRTGWRQEYSVVAEIAVDHTNLVVRDTLAYTRFAIDVSTMPRGEAALKAAEYEHEEIRQARALLKAGSDFDFEIQMGNPNDEEVGFALAWLKERGHAPQFIGVGAAVSDAVAEVARQHKVSLSFRYAGEPLPVIESRVRATAGRLNYYVADPSEAEIVAEGLMI